MSAPRHPAAFTASLRRLLAGSGVAVMLALTVFAASPTLHNWLHGEGDCGGSDACPVALLGQGLSLSAGITALPPVAHEWAAAVVPLVEEISLVSPRYLRQPERGPPAVCVG